MEATTPKVGKSALKGNAGKGRKKGVPNKVTREFRETVKNLLEGNADNVARWLAMVAEGDGGDLKPDPGKALDLMAKLAEYATPKLARTEHAGEGGGAIILKVSSSDDAL